MKRLLLLALLALPAQAQTPRDLREAERTAQERRQAAEQAAAEARRRAAEEVQLADRRVEAAGRLREAEAALAEARARAAAAGSAGADAAAAVRARSEALRPLLPVMLRLGVWPAETVLAVPAPPEEALRGALVLRGMVRQMESEAAALREAQAQAVAALAAARQEEAALAAAERAARAAAGALDAELAEARRRREAAAAEEDRAAERAEAAAGQARDLGEALQRLEMERIRREWRERASAEARAAAEARRQAEAERERRLAAESRARPQREAAAPAAPPPTGGRALPVAGRVTLAWGERGPAGPHRGLTFAAPPNARIVSPCAGRVAFAAPFRSFGLLLIVDCGAGYHFVLGGLGRLDTAAGQRLLAGEPVGALGGAGDSASLYVELRRNGQPVDPRPWFASRG
jgi:septal ring factor EnvC (AmiA/AmiB activator)